MHLIAFNGVMGSGKSEAIKTLRELLGPERADNVVLVKFASTLYDVQEYIYGKIEPVYKRPADFVKDRKLLQWIGTEWGRGIDQDLWVKLWHANVLQEASFNPDAIIVCDDVRFDNEAGLVKESGGVIVKLVCNFAQERITTANGIKNHASEAGIGPQYVDYIVDNNSTLESYKNSLRELYQRVGVI
jgi:energy-coupling factor transporter ATP-binding protein EcfA2